MKALSLTFGASAAVQTVRASGRGYISLLSISHAESAAQAVTFYAGSGGARLAHYIVALDQSPYTLAFPRGYSLWFEGGLQVLTGSCVVNLTVVF